MLGQWTSRNGTTSMATGVAITLLERLQMFVQHKPEHRSDLLQVVTVGVAQIQMVTDGRI
jgi:hypothetical protein